MSVFAFIAADLVAIAIMVFGLYFPRHRRRDLIVAFLSINVGVMGVTYAMATAELSLGFGLGIFAVLSIIRLRSTEMDHAEIAYYFTAIALGLLGGFPSISPYVSFTLMAVLLGVIAAGDLAIPPPSSRGPASRRWCSTRPSRTSRRPANSWARSWEPASKG